MNLQQEQNSASSTATVETIDNPLREIPEATAKLDFSAKTESSGSVVKIQKIHQNAQLPAQSNPGDAGYDLTAVTFEKKDFSILAHTGLKMELPPGYEAQIRSRSGLALKGCVVVNSPGTIDAGYRGEICVILGSTNGSAPCLPDPHNRSAKVGNADLVAGDRVAQLVIKKVPQIAIQEVESIDTDTDRGEGGFGSTGLK